MNKDDYLSDIQIVDPYVKSVVFSSNYVALISYDKQKECWERRAVDGLFLAYQRLAEPYYACAIINRTYRKNYFIRTIVKNLRFLQESQYIHIFEPDSKNFF